MDIANKVINYLGFFNYGIVRITLFFRLYPGEPFVAEKIVTWKGINKYGL